MATKKSGLGKGLDSLIPKGTGNMPKRTENKEIVVEKVIETVVEKVIEEKIVYETEKVKISLVEPNREQPRKQFEEDALLELSESIKIHGVLQPLLVQRKEGYFEIIAGERRWRAAKIAGLKEIPVIVKDYTDLEVVEIALIENIQRENLNPIEEALGYKRLLDEFHLKQDEIAEKVSKSRTAVTNTMRLLKLCPAVQQMIIDEMLATGHARALLAIDDEEFQHQIALKIFDEKLSVREVEKLIKDLKKPKKEEKEIAVSKNANNFVYEDIENKIHQILGTKVNVKHNKDKGKIEVEYYSDEELERIFDLLMSIKN